MGSFGGDKQHRAGVFACGYARAATNALRGVHGAVGVVLWNGNRIGVRNSPGRNGNEPASLNDAIERVAVNDEVFDDRKCLCAPRFDRDRVTVLEMPQVQLAGGGAFLAAVWN